MQQLRMIAVYAAFVAFGSVSGASAEDPRATMTLDQRVKALEVKTNYYTKKSQKVVTTLAKTNGHFPGCENPDDPASEIKFSLDPQITRGGVSYAWVKATVTYQNKPGNVTVVFGPEPDQSCSKTAPAPGPTGSVNLSKFCSFNVEPKETYQFTVYTSALLACKNITGVTVELKTTNIEVVEPVVP
jgi:hypothetical protein